jgi:hypothetical protein
MMAAERCVICEGDISSKTTGLVAPFLAERIWQRKAFAIKLAKCGSCGFLFFNPRLEEHEAKLLYDDYRSERYQQMRFRHEPWYTKAFNSGLSDEKIMVARRELLHSIVAENAGFSGIETVLDFGGDQGQLIQDLPVANKYVYDISGVEKRPGIVGISDFAGCLAHRYDLIVCSNVLEHVGFPRELVSQIRQLANPGTLIYLDAPLESPLTFSSVTKRLAQMLIVSVARTRDALAVLKPSGIYLMHEHINFFSVKSLATLAEQLEFQVIATGRYGMNGPILGGDCVWCLARLK